MPVLTGALRDVSGSLLAPEAVRRIFVKAPTLRGSYTGEALIVTKDVDLSTSGNVTVDLEPGPAVLVVYTDTSQDTFELWVTDDMETLSEAVAENDPNLPWQESRMKALLDEAVQQIIDAGVIAGDVESDRVAAEVARAGSEAARDQSVTARNETQGFRNEADQFAADANQSATDSESSAQASAGSAAAAAGSASTAGTNRSAAEAARTGAETARTGAETARSGAESAQAAAEAARDEFGLTVSGTTTGAEGSNASVTLSGNGPEYALSFAIPRGDKGEQGDQGPAGLQEVAWTDDGRPYLLDVAAAEQGDSGWRTIDTKNNSGGNPNRLDIRRVGGTCYARVFGQPGWANNETITFAGTPDGFKHELGKFHDNAYGGSAPIVTNIGNGQPTDCGRIAYRLWVNEEVQVRITNNGTRYWVAELSWFTSDPWPETLPGTAV